MASARAAIVAWAALQAFAAAQSAPPGPKSPAPPAPPGTPTRPADPFAPREPDDRPGGEGEGTPSLLQLAGERVAWSATLDAAPGGGVAMVGGLAIVGTTAGSVYAFEPPTGREVWRASLGAPIFGAPLASPRGEVIAATAGGHIHALDRSSGVPVRATVLEAPLLAPLAARGDVVAARTSIGIDLLGAADLARRRRLGDPLLLAPGAVMRPLAVMNGAIVEHGPAGLARAWNPDDGASRWRESGVPTIPNMDPVAVTGGVGGVLLGGQSAGVRLIEPLTGVERWRAAAGATAVGAIEGPDGLLVTFLDRRIVKLDPAEGRVLASALLSGAALGPPIRGGTGDLAVPLIGGRTELLSPLLTRTAVIDHRSEPVLPGVAVGDGVVFALRERLVFKLRL